jgi:hypothetical protein
MSNNPHTVPKGGFIGTGNKASVYNAVTSPHHNVATASASEYVLGQKIRYYNSTLKGWGTCIYLQYDDGEAAIAEAAGHPCGVLNNGDNPYKVSANVAEVGVGAPRAISLSAMTDQYYGWFWCGGVCPDFLVDGGASAYSAVVTLVGTNVTAGTAFINVANLTITVATNDATFAKMGYSLIATGDTNSDLANLVLYDLWP